MWSRPSAFVVWALVAGSLVFWGLRLLARPDAVPREALPVSLAQAVRGDLTRLFPAPVRQEEQPAEQPGLASRLRVLGVVAPRIGPSGAQPDAGVVLISLDGRPPRAVRMGERIDRREELVVQSIEQTRVVVGTANGGQITLSLPPLPPPAVGSLPPPEPLIEGVPLR